MREKDIKDGHKVFCLNSWRFAIVGSHQVIDGIKYHGLDETPRE